MVLVVASLLFAASVLGGLVKIGQGTGDAVGANQAAALLAARTQALAVYTVDPERVESQSQAVLNGSAGKFYETYAAERFGLVKSVREKKRVLTAAVPEDGVAIAHFSGKEAVVLVAINVTTKEGGRSETSPYRLRLSMVREGIFWKSAALDVLNPVSGPGIFIPGDLPGGNSPILSAAAKGTEVMYSYDSGRIEEGKQAFLPLVTERYAPIFTRIYLTSGIAVLTRSSVVDSYARAVGLIVRDKDFARCLVYLDQVIQDGDKSRAVGSRLYVDLRRVDGTWLVDGLGSP